MKKKIRIMCLADATTNPRPSRLLRFFKKRGDNLDVIGFLPSYPTNFDYFVIQSQKGFKWLMIKALSLFFMILQKIVKIESFSDFTNNLRYGIKLDKIRTFASNDYDYIFCEDLQLLPLAVKLKKSSKLFFDAREIYTEQDSKSLFFRIFEKRERDRLLKKYLPKCDVRLTVNEKIKEFYEKQYNSNFEVILSAPIRSIHNSPLKTSGEIKLVHHGLANKNRHIENMILACNSLEDHYSADFYLSGSEKHIDFLKKFIDSEKVRILPPVDFKVIPEMLSQYDVGIYLLKPENMNLNYSLPNKFFEFINSGLAVCTGPSPVMSRIINEQKIGFVSESFSSNSFRNALEKFSQEKIEKFKKNSRIAAEKYNWENQEKILSDLL